MIIGVPKEIKNNENRVGMTPAGVAELVKKGHTVYVQATAGVNSGFSDDDYIAVGAKTLPTIEDTYAAADMIVKVKEPIAPEYKLIKKGQVVFTYFHFAADKLLTEAMIESGAVCIAYETVEKEDHSLPLLTPMSEVAGRMATQVGARFLEKPQGGKGKLMGGVTGVRPARVLILGGGIVGTNAAQIAAGMGAEVLIADINLPRLRYLSEVMPKNVKTLYSSTHNIKMELPNIDLVIGSVLIPGDKAPQRPYLHCGRNCTLRRCQYPRRRTLHLHHGTDKCHPALHRSPGMQRLETSLQGRPGSGAGIERSGRQSNIQSCSRRLRAEI